MTANSSTLPLAIQHHRAKRWREAEQSYRQVLKEQPQQLEALYGLGLLGQQTGQFQVAEEFLSKAVAVQPKFLKGWFALGNLHQARGQLPEAETAYRQAIVLKPDLAPLYNNLGYTLQQQGQFDEAIACYQKALAIDPKCPEADVNWGNALYAQGKLSPEKQRHYAQFNYKLGLMREEAGDWQTAEVYYQQAIAMQPDLANAHEQSENTLTEPTSLLSFDIFDTLITRFCIDPDEIFFQVERLTRFENFAYYRKKAEDYLLRNTENYDLEDIYLKLAAELNLNRCDLEHLKDAEVEAEIQNVIGIKENLEQVKDGDLLISDMYLPENVLRQMLHKAGLEKQVNLYVTAKGKHNGTAWREITDAMKITRHLGDNLHSDVQMAQRYGIKANLYQAAQPSPVEKALHEIGAKNLAKVIRKIRLVNHFKDPLQQNFYQCFVQGNLVILVAFSVFLLRIAQQNKLEQYLFSSRDCYHLHKIFRQIVSNSDFFVDCTYFFTSRLARVKCSEDYLSYLLDLVTKKRNSAIVDLGGTGFSLSYLFQKISQDFSLPIVFFHHTDISRVQAIYQDNKLNDTIFSLIPRGPQNLNIDALETLNYIKQPMIKDVIQQGENEYVPVFCSNSIPFKISKLIDCTEEIIDHFSNHLNPEVVDEILHQVDGENFKRLSLAIYQQLSLNQDLLSSFMYFHDEENKRVEAELSAMLTQER